MHTRICHESPYYTNIVVIRYFVKFSKDIDPLSLAKAMSWRQRKYVSVCEYEG